MRRNNLYNFLDNLFNKLLYLLYNNKLYYLYNLLHRLLYYITIIWNRYGYWILIISLWIIFYLIGWLTISRLYRFIVVLCIIWLYKILIKQWTLTVRHSIKVMDNKYGINIIYKWLCFFLKFNLYKNIFLYILLKADYLACDFLGWINKRFLGNLWVCKFFNILVRHLSLLIGLQVIYYKLYFILYTCIESNMLDIIVKRKYGLIFSILIFTDIITFVKSFIIAYPLIGTYSIILLIGILYEIPFTSRMFNLYMFNLMCLPRLIYNYRAQVTLVGIITIALSRSYKNEKFYKDIILDKTLLMDFNNKFFDALLFDDAITTELKFEDFLKFNQLQTLFFLSSLYYLDNPYVFSYILYKYYLSVAMMDFVNYYYYELYIDELKEEFNANDIIKMEVIKRNHLKVFKLIIYLIWDMEYYLDKNFNPIANKSLRLDYTKDFVSHLYNIELYGYKKFKNFDYLISLFVKKKDNEIDFFNINLNYKFYEKVFYIKKLYGYSNNFYYSNKTYELKYNLYNKIVNDDSCYVNMSHYIYSIASEDVPNQRDSYYINNKINIFMNEWIMQRDEDVKEANYKRLKEVEEEMEFLINHQLKDE